VTCLQNMELCFMSDGGHQRGKIQSTGRASQLIIFEGMKWEKITPTDIDLFIEARGAYVIGEFKLQGKALDRGQRMALERLHRDLQPAKCLMFVAEHRTPLPHPVIAKDCTVIEAVWNNCNLTAVEIQKVRNVKNLIDRFIYKYAKLESAYLDAAGMKEPLAVKPIMTPELHEWVKEYDGAEGPNNYDVHRAAN